MENVKALGTLQKWENVRDAIHTRAKQLGFTSFQVILNSADYGVPQKRERVFFIGFKNALGSVSADFNKALDNFKNHRTSLRQCLSSLPKAGSELNPITCSAKISLAIKPVLRKSPYAGMLFNGLGRPLEIDAQANTLPASMGGNKTPIIDERNLNDPNSDNWIVQYHNALLKGIVLNSTVEVPKYLRRITIREASAIQTIFSVVRNRQYIDRLVMLCLANLLKQWLRRHLSCIRN
jgi:DNA (cytosine-5)-methyltransferase 1